MNLKRKSESLLTLFILFFFMSISAFAQTTPVYVDVTNGSDSYTGVNATNNPAGSGPKATIGAGLAALSDNGTLIIAAGTYNGVDNAGGNIDINSTTYPALKTGVTIELRQLASSNAINVTAGNFIVNLSGTTAVPVPVVTITATNLTEALNLTSSNVQIKNGNLNLLSSAYLVLPATATITLTGTSTFVGNHPTVTNGNINLSYIGASSVTAGLEATYSSLGSGSLTVTKTSGAVTINNGLTFSGNTGNVINVTSGNAIINGAVALGLGDIAASGTSSITINGDVAAGLSTGAGVTAADLSQIVNAGTGSITVTGTTTWTGGDYTALKDFTGASINAIDNQGAGTIALGPVALTASGATTNVGTNEFTLKANNAGTLNVGLVTAAAATSTLTYNIGDLSLVNSGTATLAGGKYRGGIANTGTLTSNTNDLRADGITNAATKTFTVNANLVDSSSVSNNGTLIVTGTATVVTTLANAGTGTLSVAGAAVVKGAITNGKTLTLGSLTSSSTINNAAASTITLNGASSSTGLLTNVGTIALGANTLTLTGSVAHATNGGTVTGAAGGITVTPATTASFDGGTFTNVTVTKGVVTLQTNAVTATGISVTGGTLAANIATTATAVTIASGATITVADAIILTTGDFTQNGGTFTLGATSGLTVKGNFNRITSTFTAPLASTVLFNGTAAQAFNAGPLLQLGNLTLTNTAGIITVGQSLRAGGTVTISANTAAALGTNNIILNSTGSSIVNNGSYTATAGGGVVVGGLNIGVVGGANVTGVTISGTGAYSNITIDPGTGNPVTVNGPVIWNQDLTLNSGSVAVAAATDLSPAGSSARIIRNVVSSTGIDLTAAGSSFNGAAKNYSLTYNGTLTGNVTIDATIGAELTQYVSNWTVSTKNTGANTYAVIIGVSKTFGGTLVIDSTAIVNVATTFTLTLSGASLTHTINGSLGTTGTALIDITGDNVTINDLTYNHSLSKIGKIKFDGNVTVSNISAFIGAVEIAGPSFNLGSNLEAQAGVTYSSPLGVLNFGAYNLAITTAGDFAQTGAGTYTANGGALVLNRGTANLTLAKPLPNLKVANAATLTADAEVSNSLVIGTTTSVATPILTIAAANLTVSGASVKFIGNTSAATPVVATTGALIIAKPATLLLDIKNGAVPATVTNLTIASTGSLAISTDYAYVQTLEVATALVQHGDIATAGNILKLSGSYTPDANNITSTFGGKTQFNLAAAANFAPQAAGLSIDNLDVIAAATNSTSKAFTVAKNLILTAGAFSDGTAGKLSIGDKDTITVVAGTLTNVPTFAGTVSLNYLTGANYTTGNEVPATTATKGVKKVKDASTLANLIINPGAAANTITLGSDAIVNSSLQLLSGKLDFNSKKLTLADPTVTALGTNDVDVILAGGTLVTGSIPTVSSFYNLTYSTGTTTGPEFLSGSIDTLTVSGATTVIPLPANTTVNDVVITGGGTLNASTYDLTINGAINVVKGNVTSTTGTLTFVKDLILNNTTFAPAGTVKLQSNLTVNSGASFAPTGSVIFAGNELQTITIPSGITTIPTLTINQTVNKTSDIAQLKVKGGNLSITKELIFINGLLVLDDSTHYVYLPRPDGAANSGLGFDRTAVENGTTNYGYIVGNIAKAGKAGDGSGSVDGRFVFPSGAPIDTTVNAKGDTVYSAAYRPVTITFTNSYPLGSPTTLVVRNVNRGPAGSVGFPITSGNDGTNDVKIGKYAPYYWAINSLPSGLSQTQSYDIELQGTNLKSSYKDYTSLRGIRRLGTSENNKWYSLSDEGTSNAQMGGKTSADTIVWVRATASAGGILQNESRFSIGVPVQAPVIGLASSTPIAVGNTITVPEGTALTANFGAVSSINGTTPTITGTITPAPTSSKVAPAFTATGSNLSLTWTPGFSAAEQNKGVYVVAVTATDGGGTATIYDTIVVTNTNQAPKLDSVVVATNVLKTTIPNVVKYYVSDADAADTISWTTTVTPTPKNAPVLSATTGKAVTVTFTPASSEAGIVFKLHTTFTDGKSTAVSVDTTFAKVKLNFAYGDITKDGFIHADDALEALRMSVGYKTFNNSTVVYTALDTTLADVNGDKLVTPYDAYKILWKSVNPDSLLPIDGGPAKAIASSGNLSLGKIASTTEANVVSVPLTLDEALNVNSFSYELNYDAKLADVKVDLTELTKAGWLAYSRVDNGVIKVVGTGVTPLAAGSLAKLNFTMKNKEAQVSLNGTAYINNNNAQTLNTLTVAEVPTQFGLNQNYPNPFNPSTTIKYQIPEATHVTLTIYDLKGQVVKTLVNTNQEARNYSIVWDGRNNFGQQLASGVYFYRIDAGKFNATKKLMLMK